MSCALQYSVLIYMGLYATKPPVTAALCSTPSYIDMKLCATVPDHDRAMQYSVLC